MVSVWIRDACACCDAWFSSPLKVPTLPSAHVATQASVLAVWVWATENPHDLL